MHSDLGFIATRQLEARHGVYAGATTGHAYLVARWWAEQRPHQLHVVISPDKGYRYEHNIYNDGYLGPPPVGGWVTPQGPTLVTDPRHTHTKWTIYAWRRRKRAEVMRNLQA